MGKTYFEVVKHAFLPAVISYIALFYISHLEALKLNLKGWKKKIYQTYVKLLFPVFIFLNPIFFLIYLLVYLRLTASFSIFYTIVTLLTVNLIKKLIDGSKDKDFINPLKQWFNESITGFQKGAYKWLVLGSYCYSRRDSWAVGSTGF
ncbi:MAG: hypothetical protein Ct9H300mP5_2810 [Candidatus Pelagibacterales bacterium]|nr:MAG: hypothetical protein Ct9H300mP5_2810 [Pelagibacterales bacterium]